jgi:hypothetical protein
MYTILVTDENELRVTLKERIMQRSKLVDSFHILVDPLYKNETDMTEFTTVYMEYILPVSKKYVTENLILTSEENTEVVNEDPDFDPEIDIEEEPKEEVKAKVVPILYKGKLEYKLKFDTNLTAEPGNIELQLTFIKTDIVEEVGTDEEGNEIVNFKTIQYIRKTSPCKITIVPISAWSDIIPDEALTALDNRLAQVDAQIKALADTATVFTNEKADNIKLDAETSEIYLTANGEPLGDRISIDELGDVIIEAEEDEGMVSVII